MTVPVKPRRRRKKSGKKVIDPTEAAAELLKPKINANTLLVEEALNEASKPPNQTPTREHATWNVAPVPANV